MKGVLVLVSIAVVCVAEVHYEFIEEWRLWKSHHGRAYTSHTEELERHLVWLSNKKYIEAHNKNDDMFGYTLSMNSFGDMVYRAKQHITSWYSMFHIDSAYMQ